MKLIELVAFSLLLIISLIISFSNPSTAVVLPNAARSKIGGSKLSGNNKNTDKPKRDCTEMGSRFDCAQIPNCRWCTSDALDDMCFWKSEAGRLPSQVFSCQF